VTYERSRRPKLHPRPVESGSSLGRQSAMGAIVLALALTFSWVMIGVAIRDGGHARADLVDRVDPAILRVQRLGNAVGAQAVAVH
jgi:hypothetical protein